MIANQHVWLLTFMRVPGYILYALCGVTSIILHDVTLHVYMFMCASPTGKMYHVYNDNDIWPLG